MSKVSALKESRAHSRKILSGEKRAVGNLMSAHPKNTISSAFKQVRQSVKAAIRATKIAELKKLGTTADAQRRLAKHL